MKNFSHRLVIDFRFDIDFHLLSKIAHALVRDRGQRFLAALHVQQEICMLIEEKQVVPLGNELKDLGAKCT